MRINKYLALHKKITRREGDELVAAKKVLINGRIALPGDKITEEDIIEIRFSGKPKKYLYYAYHKPVGEITGENNLPVRDLFPLGRLDKDSSGLMILTNDGRVTDRLLNPDYDHEKEYLVKTSDKLRSNFKEKMESGVSIEGYITKKCGVHILNDNTFKITLTEGKKHQIRRMCAALFNQVKNLKRIRILNIKLNDLQPGESRPITGEELDKFLKQLGL